MGSEAPVHSIGKREILCIKYDNRYTQQRNFPTALFFTNVPTWKDQCRTVSVPVFRQWRP